ncbi:MAG: nucleotidyltransferase domain-containing protein [Firmicutes bacterium]|nr:nucleotidyltransferase domain-containing protein [Bacillota bacterium]
MNIDEKFIKTIKDFLIAKLSPSLIIIFGSVLSANFRKNSDLDIAFLAQREVDPYKLFIITQELASLLSRDVDLVDLSQLSTVFKTQIIGKGEVIYSENKELINIFKLRTLKEYALLNEERAEIIERIEKEGKVYG